MVHGAESQTLTSGVCSKERIYCRALSKEVGDKPQIHSNLIFEFELGFVLLLLLLLLFLVSFVCLFVFRRTKRLGLIIVFLIFLNCCFGSLDASGL